MIGVQIYRSRAQRRSIVISCRQAYFNRRVQEVCAMNRIDVRTVPQIKGSVYPAGFDRPCRERLRQALGDAVNLTDFGVNLLLLPAGAWSSQRHWHSAEDE